MLRQSLSGQSVESAELNDAKFMQVFSKDVQSSFKIKRFAKIPLTWTMLLPVAGVSSFNNVNAASMNDQSSAFSTAVLTPQAGFNYPYYFKQDGSLDTGHVFVFQYMYIGASPKIHSNHLRTLFNQQCTAEIKVSGAHIAKVNLHDVPVRKKYSNDRTVGTAANPEYARNYVGSEFPKDIGFFVGDSARGIGIPPQGRLEILVTFPSGWASTLFGAPGDPVGNILTGAESYLEFTLDGVIGFSV